MLENTTGKITILVDNRAESPLIFEHGFAVLIESQGKRILFDTGQGDVLFSNSRMLNLSLENLDILILSHGHYDHGGNIDKILSLNPSIEFFAHPDCLRDRYSYHRGKPLKYAGLSENSKKAIKKLPEKQIHWCSGKTKILKNIFITGYVPRINSLEDTGGNFFLDEEMTIPDLINDDISLWIEDPTGLTILCGCCHSGLQNTVNYILSSYEKSKPVNTILGGFHLVHSRDDRIIQTVNFLKEIRTEKVIGAHCTGDEAIKIFQKNMDRVFSVSSAGLAVRLQAL